MSMTDLQKQAQEAADRMYASVFQTGGADGNIDVAVDAMQVAVDILRMIERGELREVVCCGECVWRNDPRCRMAFQDSETGSIMYITMFDDDFCSAGRRNSDGQANEK